MMGKLGGCGVLTEPRVTLKWDVLWVLFNFFDHDDAYTKLIYNIMNIVIASMINCCGDLLYHLMPSVLIFF